MFINQDGESEDDQKLIMDDDNQTETSVNQIRLPAHQCAQGCHYLWVKDGFCDETCNVAACRYDGGDCKFAKGVGNLTEDDAATMEPPGGGTNMRRNSYALGTVNTNGCGSQAFVDTLAGCQAANTALGISSSVRTETDAAWPKGCYKYSSFPDQVFFNYHSTGSAHAVATPICDSSEMAYNCACTGFDASIGCDGGGCSSQGTCTHTGPTSAHCECNSGYYDKKCSSGTAGSNSTAGTTCSSAWCTSPNGYGGHDCWAGRGGVLDRGEPCTCSQGSARLTGETTVYRGDRIYKYTCCDGGDNVGEECGDCCTNVGLMVSLVIVLPICCCFCIVACLIWLWKTSCAGGTSTAANMAPAAPAVIQPQAVPYHGQVSPIMAAVAPGVGTGVAWQPPPEYTSQSPPPPPPPPHIDGLPQGWASAPGPQPGSTYYYNTQNPTQTCWTVEEALRIDDVNANCNQLPAKY